MSLRKHILNKKNTYETIRWVHAHPKQRPSDGCHTQLLQPERDCKWLPHPRFVGQLYTKTCNNPGHTKRRATTGRPRGYGRPHSQNATERYAPCLQALFLFARAIANIGELLLGCTNNSKCNTEWCYSYL